MPNTVSKLHVVTENDSKSPELNLSQKTAIVLVQLGTPDEATPSAVRCYLREFLSDRHVIETNPIIWQLILNLFILTFRPKKSAALYDRLFSQYGPVLLTYTQSLTAKIADAFADTKNLSVHFGMRYGNPSLKKLIESLLKDQTENILVLPLFAQYSNTTTGSVIDCVNDVIKKSRTKADVRFIHHFHKHPAFVANLVRSIQTHLDARKTPPERIVLSYHGLPQSYVNQGDPYDCMCKDTTDLLKEHLNYPAENIVHVYQSRFGPQQWLQPYTDETLAQLASSGIKDVMVACPAFTMDCLETLDEMGVENRHVFLENGGKNYELVSCLNDDDGWANDLTTWLRKELKAWATDPVS